MNKAVFLHDPAKIFRTGVCGRIWGFAQNFVVSRAYAHGITQLTCETNRLCSRRPRSDHSRDMPGHQVLLATLLAQGPSSLLISYHYIASPLHTFTVCVISKCLQLGSKDARQQVREYSAEDFYEDGSRFFCRSNMKAIGHHGMSTIGDHTKSNSHQKNTKNQMYKCLDQVYRSSLHCRCWRQWWQWRRLETAWYCSPVTCSYQQM